MGENLDRNRIVLKNLPEKFRSFFFIRTAKQQSGRWFCLPALSPKFGCIGFDRLPPNLWNLTGSIDSKGCWEWDGKGIAAGNDGRLGSPVTLLIACGSYDRSIEERDSNVKPLSDTENVHAIYQPLTPTSPRYGNHCPEPYSPIECDGVHEVIAGPFGTIPCSTLVCTVSPELRNPKATAERIAACVNACAGMKPDAVPRLIEAVQSAIDIIDDEDRDSCFDVDVLEILEEALLAAKPDAS